MSDMLQLVVTLVRTQPNRNDSTNVLTLEPFH